jgi:hypothetical protein
LPRFRSTSFVAKTEAEPRIFLKILDFCGFPAETVDDLKSVIGGTSAADGTDEVAVEFAPKATMSHYR